MSVWQVAFAFLGSMIGAGFVSGREVYSFFSAHGPAGNLGVVLSVMLFATIGPTLLLYFRSRSLTSYRDLFETVAGPRLGACLDGLLSLFLFVTLSIVLAAGASLMSQLLQLPELVSGLILAGVTVVLARLGPGRLAPFQGALMVLLLAALVAIFSGTLHTPSSGLGAPGDMPWWVGAALYPGYNLLLAAGYLPFIAQGRSEASTLLVGGLVGAGLLGALLMMVHGINLRFGAAVTSEPLPLLHAARRAHPGVAMLYVTALGGATLLSSPSYLLSVAKRFHVDERTGWLLLIAALTLPLTRLGLVRLIEVAYPFMGVLGLLFFGMLMLTMRQRSSFGG